MLSDEERKAMDSLKVISEYAGDNYLAKEHRRKLKLLIELVEKQSKEIEELSDKLTEKICKGVEEEILEEYRQTIISKDKEIEELRDKNKFYNTAYNLGKTYSNKKWKDKIKAKIEEVKDGTFDAKIVLQSLLEKE